MNDESDYDPAPTKGVSVLGIISLVMGILGSVISLVPCIGMFVGGPVAGIGLLLGVIGLIVSLTGKQSGVGFPIAGSAVSLLGLCIAGAWLAITTLWVKNIGEEVQAQAEKREQERQAIRTGPAIKMTAAALYKEYDANALAADSKYKGKVLEVTGRIEGVNAEGFTATVELKTDAEGDTVDCTFALEQQHELVNLKPGQQVTIRGRGTGREGSDSPTLESCILMK
ncbi:MAG TPA: hypothetical protein VH643_15270 [Gemmataceae bacterium]|jgi:hypothetical protein